MDRLAEAWYNGHWVTKGSDTSGNWRHRGVKNAPWGKGGSAPGGGHQSFMVGSDPDKIKQQVQRERQARMRKQALSKEQQELKKAGFDEVGERNKLMTIEGQASKPKPGVTKAQMQRFYDRLNAVKAAREFKYQDGSSAIRVVLDALKQGMRKIINKPAGRIELQNPDSGAALLFQHTAATNLIRVLLGDGKYKRNY